MVRALKHGASFSTKFNVSHPLKHLFGSIIRSNLLRQFAVLASGNIFAQLIPLLMMPFFTRMFDARVFGLQALLLIGINFMVPVSTGFYEYAIPTPRSERKARQLATIAFTLALGINLAVALLLLIFKPALARMLGIEEMGQWIYAYPLVSFSASTLNISNYWMLRKGKFHLQSLNKICQATSIAGIVLALGLLNVPAGLMFGFIAGLTFTGLFAFTQAYRQKLRFDFAWPLAYYWRVMRKYAEFPIFGSIPSSINNIAAQVPVIVITAHYSLGLTGHYSVVRNLINAAMSLIAASFGQVILRHFTQKIHANERLWPYYIRISAFVVVLGLTASAGTYFMGPWFFKLYLGASWQDSVDIVRMISLCMVFWLMGPALAHAVIAIKRLRAIALWQVLHGVMAFGLTWFSSLPFHDFIARVVMYEAFSYSLYFLIMTFTIWRYDHRQKSA